MRLAVPFAFAALGFAAALLVPTAAARRASLASACRTQGDARSCERLADALEHEPSAVRFAEEPGLYLEVACERGRSSACERAQHWARTYGDYEVFELDAACMLRDQANACEEVGDALRGDGDDVATDDRAGTARMALARSRMHRALRLHEAACARGDASACLGASRVYRRGFGAEWDLVAAHARAVRACERGLSAACEIAGDDGTADARALYRRACDAGASPHACLKLARADESAGLPNATVVARYEHACALLAFDACRWVADHVPHVDAAPADVVTAFDRWCESGDPRACSALETARHQGGA